MAGYNDSKEKIVSTLTGRANGDQITPEKHQDFALSVLEYIRSIELSSLSGGMAGFAQENTVPIQPDNSFVTYLSAIPAGRTLTYSKFLGVDGLPLTISSNDDNASFVVLYWDKRHWSYLSMPVTVISKGNGATFNYRFNVRKTYPNKKAMLDDSSSPVDPSGERIKVGELVSVVNNEDSRENGLYSYTGSAWAFQGNMNVEIVNELGDHTTKVMSQKSVTKEFEVVRAQITSSISTAVTQAGDEIRAEMREISNASAKAVRDAESAQSKASENAESIREIKGDIDLATAMYFDGVVNNVSDVKVDTLDVVDRIVYSKTEKAFYAVRDHEYYSKWPNASKYNDTKRGGGIVAKKGKLFVCDQKIYVWSDQDGGIVESGKDVGTILSLIESKMSNVVSVVKILENGENPTSDGKYLSKSVDGKITSILSLNGGARQSEAADLAKIYVVAGDTYLYNGKEFDKIGASAGTGGGSGGSGSGFMNVTALVPIAPRYYDKQTAVEALRRLSIDDKNKSGLIITFETSDKEWSEYRFTSSDVSHFYDHTKWVEFGIKGNFIRNINFNGEKKEPNEKGSIDLNIVVPTVEDTINEGSSNAVSGGAVFAEIKRLKESIPSRIRLDVIGDGDEKKYSISLLNDSSDDPIDTTDQFTAGGGNGKVAATRIELTRVTQNNTVKFGDDVKLQYRFRHVDTTSGDSTGTSGKVSVSIIRGASSTNMTDVIASGETKEIDVTKYLVTGTNNVRVRVEVGEGEERQVSSINWTISVVQLTLNSSFDVSTVSYAGDNISIPYSLTGNGNKTLKMIVNGEPTDERQINTSTSNGLFTLNTARLRHRAAVVQMVAELQTIDGTLIKSNSIILGVIVAQRSINLPIVGFRIERQDGKVFGKDERITIAAKQFDSHTITYSAFDPTETPTPVTVSEDGVVISNSRVPLIQQSVNVRSTKSGEVIGEITCKSSKFVFGVSIEKTSLNIEEPTDGLVLSLSTQGKSNNDTDRASWSYKDITSTLSGFNFGGDGWINGYLRHVGSARTTINFKPFKQVVPSTNAFSMVMKFKCSSVLDDNAIVASCVDATGTGFEITPTEARFTTSGKTQLSMKMASGVEHEVAFVSFPRAEDHSSAYEKENTEMVYLYINGIMCGALQRGTADSIYQSDSQPITIGSDLATIDVKSIKFYNNYLSDSQILSLYIIGQNNVDTLINLFNQNDIVDDNGDISVEKIKEGTRVIIVTGKQVTGVPTMLHAAVTNNKKTKFDVDEILSFVKGGDPRQNFRILGGSIALQGTSSLAYPTKNYRLYSKSAKKAAGQLYVGVNERGEGGTLQDTHKYSFKIKGVGGAELDAAPVDCWCAKADYAESSSSHNTGMARLVHNTLVAVGDLTPPQKHVDRSKYAYDVRTTVDGEPCLMFYRANPTDKPVFLGKFNLNNDKSTEDVFGFLKIKGYHDADWLKTKFGGNNPTECWEFLNNDYPMGSFKDDDFDTKDRDGKPNWLKVFEARFPDDDALNAQYKSGEKKPAYLEALVKWVKSTDTDAAGLSEEQKRQRRQKFKTELSQYFDVKYLCSYYILTDIFAAVDQRVKNMMMAFWYNPEVGRVLAYMIFYDNDTINGVRNDGRLKYNWDVTWETIDGELTTQTKKVYAFAGHDSVLWKNLRTEFDAELKKAYVRIRTKMTNDVIFNMFDDEQSDKFPARVFNVDAIRKYIDPKTLGVSVNRDGQVITQKYSYLESMHGDRKTHRHWFLTNRLGLFDAWCSTGLYTATDITWKGNSAAGSVVRATAAREFYFEFKREGTSMIHKRVAKGEEFTYRYDQVANIGTIFHLLGGAWIKKLDLSDWGGFTDVNLPNLPVLDELIMGNERNTYGLTEFSIGTNLPMMKKLSMRNYINIPSLNLSKCSRLEEVDLRGCSRLSTVVFAESAPIKSLKLPMNFQTLSMVSLPVLTRSGIEFEGMSNLIGLRCENCANISGIDLYKEIAAAPSSKLAYLRIDGIDKHGDGSELREIKAKGVGGIDVAGNLVNGKCKLIGNYQLTSYIEEEEFNAFKEYFDELNLRQPEYTTIEITDNVPDPKCFTNEDNKTGYKYNNEYKPSAHLAKILDKRYACVGKQRRNNTGVMEVFRLHPENFLKFADNPVQTLCTDSIVDMSQGDLFMCEPLYWYKGVNDVLNNKKYACFATDVKPSRPNVDVITFDDIERAGGKNVNFGLLIGSQTITSGIVPDLDYTTYKVSVEGYKMVRFMGCLAHKSFGATFFDADSQRIEDVSISFGNNDFLDGMYLIKRVPARAKWLVFTTCNKYDWTENKKVVLSKTDNIVDLEPDWVEHPECLVGIFKGANIRSKFGSGIDGETGVIQTNQSFIRYKTIIGQRKLDLMSYSQYKDIANLVTFKYGSKSVEVTHLHYGDGYDGWKWENVRFMLRAGIQSSFKNSSREDGFFERNGSVKSWRACGGRRMIEGYFNLTQGYFNPLEGTFADPSEDIEYFNVMTRNVTITTYDGKQRKIYETKGYDAKPTERVIFERHMDILRLSQYQREKATSSTYYAKGSESYSGGDILHIGRRYYDLSIHGIIRHGDKNRNATSEITFRIAFNGRVEEIKDLNEYLSINDFY